MNLFEYYGCFYNCSINCYNVGIFFPPNCTCQCPHDIMNYFIIICFFFNTVNIFGFTDRTWRRPHDVMNFVDLVQLVGAGKEREQAHNLEKNTADSPEIHFVVVVAVCEEALWCSVPPSVVCVCVCVCVCEYVCVCVCLCVFVCVCVCL